MAQIRKLKTGFQVRWREGGRGCPMLNSAVFPTRAGALTAKAQIEAKVAAKRRARDRAVLPINEVLERWADSRINRGNDPMWTELARARLERLVQKAAWTNTGDITPTAIEHWRNGAYNARLGGTLGGVLRWAQDFLDQPLEGRVLVALRPPRTRQTRRTLLSDEYIVEQLEKAKAVSLSVHALLHCLTTYGWRPISAAKLRVGDVNIKGSMLTLRGLKGGGDDLTHPIGLLTVELLAPLVEGRPPSEPIFLHPCTGLGWTLKGRGSIPPWYRTWSDSKIYDLKRWAISRMLSMGLAPQEVALFTGHKTISQVLRYAQTNEQKARAALERFAM